MLNSQSRQSDVKQKFTNQQALINKNNGFTMLELIIVIIILGVMSLGITSFISLSTQTYLNVSERDDLLSSARFAIERLNREIRNAVPNSIRITPITPFTTQQCIEFIPIKASTIYTNIPVVPDNKRTNIDVVNFVNSQDDPFSSCSGTCPDYIVVYPLTPSDVYDFDINSGDGKVTQLKPFSGFTGDIWTLPIEPTGGMVFDQHSPTDRLYVFDSTVSYCVSNFQLKRFQGNNFEAFQSLTPVGSESLMAENVTFDKDNPPFVYSPASLQRNAVVQIKLHFNRDGEEIVFNNDVHIENIP
jgi:MSHA biogenesis protein MshO